MCVRGAGQDHEARGGHVEAMDCGLAGHIDKAPAKAGFDAVLLFRTASGNGEKAAWFVNNHYMGIGMDYYHEIRCRCLSSRPQRRKPISGRHFSVQAG